MWIGINDKANEGVFRYESSGQTLTYSNWNPNEPNNWENREHCGELYVGHSTAGKWNDGDCSQKIAFACESNGGINSYQF